MNLSEAIFVGIAVATSTLAAPRSAEAGLIIEIESKTFSPGQGGFVDVFISSDDGADAFAAFEASFAITPASGVGTQMRLSGATDITDRSGYVFDNGGNLSSFPLIVAPPNPPISPLLTISDGLLDPLFFVPISQAIPTAGRLLARLELSPGPGTLEPREPDSFVVSLDSFSAVDDLFFPITTNLTSTSGTVTIASPSQVIPEPAAGIIWIIGLGMLAIGRRRFAHPQHDGHRVS